MTADFASLIWIERKTMDFVKDLKSEDKEILTPLRPNLTVSRTRLS